MLDERGRILRDNLYGTIEEDVWRRDFTANALYYNIMISRCGTTSAVSTDARARVLRLIGDPETRYREDPVRMLRAVRFAAKLDFTIHPDTRAPIPKLAWMLDGVPPARLFDEVNKMFLGGHARQRAFELLGELRAARASCSRISPTRSGDAPDRRARASCCDSGLQGTDERVRADKSVTPTFLFAVLLWPAIQRAYDRARAREDGDPKQLLSMRARGHGAPAGAGRGSEAIHVADARDRRPAAALRAARGRRALRLLDHPRFRAAYDFLLLRAAAGEVDEELATWWTEIQALPAEERIARVEQRARCGDSSLRPRTDAAVAVDAARRRA